MNEQIHDSTPLDDPFDRAYLGKNYLDLGCADVLTDVFRIFLESSRAKIEGLRLAMADGLQHDVLALAHGLKGEAGSVGGRYVAEIASAMEKAVRNGDMDEARSRLPELERELERLLKAIVRELGE